MEFFKKTVIYSLIIAFFTALLGIISLYGMKKDERFRSDVVNLAKRVKSFVYLQATLHNPEGDMLPDQIDDVIISETKNMLK